MQDVLLEFDDKLAPAHTAVLVVDMQNDFCAEDGYIHRRLGVDMSANEPLAKRIMTLVTAARRAGAAVVWIKANYEPRYLSGQARAKRQEKQIEDICCEGGSWGWGFYGVTPAPDEWVIEKHTFSAFFGTELDRLLRFRGIRTLVVTGVATNVRVESTLRDGYFNGYYIVMPEDCIGSHETDLHAGTIKNVRQYFGDVPSSGEVMASWTDD